MSLQAIATWSGRSRRRRPLSGAGPFPQAGLSTRGPFSSTRLPSGSKKYSDQPSPSAPKRISAGTCGTRPNPSRWATSAASSNGSMRTQKWSRLRPSHPEPHHPPGRAPRTPRPDRASTCPGADGPAPGRRATSPPRNRGHRDRTRCCVPGRGPAGRCDRDVRRRRVAWSFTSWTVDYGKTLASTPRVDNGLIHDSLITDGELSPWITSPLSRSSAPWPRMAASPPRPGR